MNTAHDTRNTSAMPASAGAPSANTATPITPWRQYAAAAMLLAIAYGLTPDEYAARPADRERFAGMITGSPSDRDEAMRWLGMITGALGI